MTEEPEIRIVVTRERFEEIVSIEDSMHFLEITKKEAYDYMVQFVQNGSDVYLSTTDARKKFKKIPRKELDGYIEKFIKAVNDAHVPPQNGADSDGQP